MGRHIRLGVILLSSTAALLGCSGASDVGNQKSSPPVAWAKALNQPFSGSGGDITLTVRAGAEVFLSGKDSYGPTLPILKYTWTGANDAASGIKLLTRSASAVSFRAPETQQPLELKFKLTVQDSDDVTDDALVTVNVVGIPDPNGFLQYDGQPDVTIAAVTSSAQTLSNAVPFEITVERSIKYYDLAGTARDLALDTRELTGSWIPEIKTRVADSTCGGEFAPRFSLPLPALNADDVLAKLSPLDDKSDDVKKQLVDPSRIDEAEVILHVTIAVNPDGSGANLPNGASASVCLLDANGARVAANPNSPGDYSRNALLGAADNSKDTLASATAYYSSIGADSKLTFSAWLQANGFTDGSTDWGQIEQGVQADGAHAVYLNNFDLGFGRDMYMRIVGCDAGVTVPALGGTLDTSASGPLGKCDIAAVVINYASLEAAAKKTGALMAVAMEYSRLPGAGPSDPRVTKFYVYAPDLAGVLKRVSSANLDGRGEVYLPQACVVCHGGTPGGVDANGNYGQPRFATNGTATGFAGHGDVRAGFMSWDLTSFLYSDTDAAFSSANDPYFPKEEQDLEAKYTRDAQEASFKKLNQMAYLTLAESSAGTSSNRFDFARDLLTGWYGANFAGNSFDTGYAPAGWKNGDGSNGNNPPDAEKIYHDVFAQNCRACHVLHLPGDVSHQFAIGSYADFHDVDLLQKWLGSGNMPFARMTMDRFWVPRNGGKSAAKTLQEHLGPDAFVDPGTPDVQLNGAPDALAVGASYRIDGTGSLFLTPPITPASWETQFPAGSAARLAFTDDARTPFLVGIDKQGTYKVTLKDSSGASASWSADRSQNEIVLESATQVPLTTLQATTVPVQWSGGDGRSRILSAASSNPAITVALPANPCEFDPLQQDSGSCDLTVTAGSSGTATITVWVQDIDPEQVPLTFTVAATSGLGLASPIAGFSETFRQQLLGADKQLKSTVASGAPILDLTSAVNGTTAPVKFELVNPPAGVVILNGSKVSYTAVQGRMSRYETSSGTVRVMGNGADVGYRACLLADAQANGGPCPAAFSVNGTITVHTVAREATSPSWTTVYTNLKDNCSNCHLAPQIPAWMGSTNAEGPVFDSTCQHRTDGDKSADGEPVNAYIVQPGNSTNSALWQKPQGNWGHGGSAVPSTDPPQTSVWNAIKNWIDDGAYFTSLSNRVPQKCTAGQ